ncbi:transglutaminase-like cysteine peptidase [Desulfomicrobium escambiense]|uniref:transglutaminase-like cysteine peptidase n=1 Tax=Desulfomicrobium escambiense TaxID=29503 RepID=UPI0004012605|nr:transglutaminase-like cysteine peptidase [Desulfomicrobium escambiense]
MTRRPRALLTLIAAAILLPGLFLAERAEPMGAQGPGPEIRAGQEQAQGAEAQQGAKPEPDGEAEKNPSPRNNASVAGDQGREDGAATPAELNGQSVRDRAEVTGASDAPDRMEDQGVPEPVQAVSDEKAEAADPAPEQVADAERVRPRPPADPSENVPAQPLTGQAVARPWRGESRTQEAASRASGQPQPSGQPGQDAKGQPVRLFQTAAFRGNFDALPKWKRVLSKADAQVRVLNSCSGAGCPPGATSWQRIMSQARGLAPMEQLKAVNTFFNKWPYRLDQDAYGTSDWWATPQEFLKISGDCEDFAITKYFALRELGYSPDDLRIVILKDRIRGIAHAILAVFIDGDALVLDNVTSVIFSHDKYKHYAPYYSLNERYRWSHIPLDTKP